MIGKSLWIGLTDGGVRGIGVSGCVIREVQSASVESYLHGWHSSPGQLR